MHLVQHEPAPTNSNLPKLQHRQSPAANVVNGMLIRMGTRCGGVDLDLESWDLTFGEQGSVLQRISGALRTIWRMPEVRAVLQFGQFTASFLFGESLFPCLL